ncbi:MAG: type II toxin-antitoxin system RelE/ParE family toxin [Pirellulales bacterium]
MPKLRFSKESKQDLKRIVQFIARDKPKAARNWIKKIRERCQNLASQPNPTLVICVPSSAVISDPFM